MATEQTKPTLVPGKESSPPVTSDEAQSIQHLSLTQLYQSLSVADTKMLFRNPAQLKELYQRDARYIDLAGTGYLSKPAIVNALEDPTTTKETKRLASSLLLGYETIDQMGKSSNPLGRLPGFKFLSNADTEPGISERKLDSLVATMVPETAEETANTSALSNAALVLATAAGILVLRKVPREIVTEVGKVVFSSFAESGTKQSVLEKAFERVPTRMEVVKKFSYSTAPKIAAASVSAYAGTRALSRYDQWSEQKKVEKFLHGLDQNIER